MKTTINPCVVDISTCFPHRCGQTATSVRSPARCPASGWRRPLGSRKQSSPTHLKVGAGPSPRATLLHPFTSDELQSTSRKIWKTLKKIIRTPEQSRDIYVQVSLQPSWVIKCPSWCWRTLGRAFLKHKAATQNMTKQPWLKTKGLYFFLSFRTKHFYFPPTPQHTLTHMRAHIHTPHSEIWMVPQGHRAAMGGEGHSGSSRRETKASTGPSGNPTPTAQPFVFVYV